MADLNEKNLKAAQPGDILRDPKISGFHVRCFAERKSFYLYFRVKGSGKERKPKLGDWGSITLEQARKVARDMLAKVALGEDPVAEREAAMAAEHTLQDLWDIYWRDRASSLKTAEWYLNMWNNTFRVAPAIGDEKHKQLGSHARMGNWPLTKFNYELISNTHKVWTKERGSITANRIKAMLSSMFNFGYRPLRWEVLKENPCAGVQRNRENKRRRVAQPHELAKLAQLINDAADGPNRAGAAFLLLLIFTGARKGEIARATWSDLHGNRIILNAHKTDQNGKPRIIVLPPPAMEILDQLPRTTGTLTGIKAPDTMWERIRIEAGCPDLNIHDLRRTFASIGLSSGKLTLGQIGGLFGHSNEQTTKGYAYLQEAEALASATAVAEVIVQRMLPVPA